MLGFGDRVRLRVLQLTRKIEIKSDSLLVIKYLTGCGRFVSSLGNILSDIKASYSFFGSIMFKYVLKTSNNHQAKYAFLSSE